MVNRRCPVAVLYIISFCLVLSMVKNGVICRHLLSNDFLEKSFYGSSVSTESDGCRNCNDTTTTTTALPQLAIHQNERQRSDREPFSHMRKNSMPRQTNSRPIPSNRDNSRALLLARKEELQRGTLTGTIRGTISHPGTLGEVHDFTCDRNFLCYLTDAATGKKTYYICHRLDCRPV